MTEINYPAQIENLLHTIKPTLLVCGGSDEAIDDVSLEGFRRTYNLISLPTDELLEFVLQSWEPGEGLGVAAILLSESIGFREGGEMIRMLHSMADPEDTPVLILGQSTSDERAKQWHNLGAKGYVVRLSDFDLSPTIFRKRITAQFPSQYEAKIAQA